MCNDHGRAIDRDRLSAGSLRAARRTATVVTLALIRFDQRSAMHDPCVCLKDMLDRSSKLDLGQQLSCRIDNATAECCYDFALGVPRMKIQRYIDGMTWLEIYEPFA